MQLRVCCIGRIITMSSRTRRCGRRWRLWWCRKRVRVSRRTLLIATPPIGIRTTPIVIRVGALHLHMHRRIRNLIRMTTRLCGVRNTFVFVWARKMNRNTRLSLSDDLNSVDTKNPNARYTYTCQRNDPLIPTTHEPHTHASAS